MSTTALATKPEAAFLNDLNKPSLHALSYVLRHPDTWPKGFVWDFSECEQCAMGLASVLWTDIVRSDSLRTALSSVAREFAMPYEEAKKIFHGGAWTPVKQEPWRFFWLRTHWDFDKVTPDMVADQIDKYLAERAE